VGAGADWVALPLLITLCAATLEPPSALKVTV
jgi:hypothetical protein